MGSTCQPQGGPRAGPAQPGYIASSSPPSLPPLCPLLLCSVSVSSAPAFAYLLARLPLASFSTPPGNRRTQKTPASFRSQPAKIDPNARIEERPMMHGQQGRVHPEAPPEPDFSGEMNQSVSATSASDPSSSPLYSFHFEKPIPPPAAPLQPGGTYVVQVPKDKVFRVPPPENARLFEHHTRRAKRRRRCSCARVCTWVLAALLALAFLLAAAVGVVYIAFRPRRPAYSVQKLAVSGLAGVGNASAAPVGGAFVPAFGATVRADNSANGRVGVRYEGDASHVSVSYDGVLLAEGAWPALYQEPRNVTVFVVNAKGPGLRLSPSVRGQMAAAERLRSVSFDVDVELPVLLQLGKLKTWAVPVRARCTVAVDMLSVNAKVVSESCSIKLRILFWWT